MSRVHALSLFTFKKKNEFKKKKIVALKQFEIVFQFWLKIPMGNSIFAEIPFSPINLCFHFSFTACHLEAI